MPSDTQRARSMPLLSSVFCSWQGSGHGVASSPCTGTLFLPVSVCGVPSVACNVSSCRNESLPPLPSTPDEILRLPLSSPTPRHLCLATGPSARHRIPSLAAGFYRLSASSNSLLTTRRPHIKDIKGYACDQFPSRRNLHKTR